MDIRFIASITAINATQWNNLAGESYPFLCWEFLNTLEESGAVTAETGWQAHHILVYEDDALVALMPMYLKSHSQGEYVFDHSWANAYARHGMDYFPKFVTSIPFTPCQGPRLCLHDDLGSFGLSPSIIFQAIFTKLESLAKQHGISSWHCLFPEYEAIKNFASEQLLVREAVQFQWFNRSYSSFDDYLKTFTSKRRKNLKRERRRVQEQGIAITRLRGKEITLAHWQSFFKFYQATYWKRGMPEYLNLDFFLSLAETMPEKCLLVIAEKGSASDNDNDSDKNSGDNSNGINCSGEINSEIVAGALSIIGEDTLYGRYWGCLDEYDNLHFELCYYQGLEFCIDNKLQCFNSGAQGEHKIARGFEPLRTYSLHWIAHPEFRGAIARFLEEESQYIAAYQAEADEMLPFRSDLKIKNI